LKLVSVEKFLSPGPVGSPQMMYITLSWATDSLYYTLFSKAQVSWSTWKIQ